MIQTEIAEQDTPEFKAWLEHVPAELKPVATRYGRKKFVFMMQSGTFKEAFGMIASVAGRHPQVGQALVALQRVTGEMAGMNQSLMHWTNEELAEVQRDIERAIALAQAVPPGGKTQGGIIIASH